ncbi:TetR family transcriptional regulator [Salmonella enterica]|uniref:TetR family transcriptional regulator n=1 Tax=Salmonella enterica TaxID=28901 RepID=UPI003C6E34CF
MARKMKQLSPETQQHLLDAALHLFSQLGVSSTSLEGIAKASGVTCEAVYWHFKNKSALFCVKSGRFRNPVLPILRLHTGQHSLSGVNQFCRRVVL